MLAMVFFILDHEFSYDCSDLLNLFTSLLEYGPIYMIPIAVQTRKIAAGPTTRKKVDDVRSRQARQVRDKQLGIEESSTVDGAICR